METKSEDKEIYKDILIIGAGPAGIGTAIALKEAGDAECTILEMGEIGNSFMNWPKETRLLTPSFTSNMFMQPDLNSVSPLTSPAYSYNTEHLTGSDYARYLKDISKHFGLKIKTNIKVLSVEKDKQEYFIISCIKNDKVVAYRCKYLVWSAGEFFYPRKNNFVGDDLCIKYNDIKTFKEIEDEIIKLNNINSDNKIVSQDKQIIIGGYEAGMDTAYNLAKMGIKTLVLDKLDRLNLEIDDPSKSLSPYTMDRCIDFIKSGNIDYKKDSEIKEITLEDREYKVVLKNKKEYRTKYRPILCAGFEGSASIIKNLISKKEDGNLDINNYDESNASQNLFFTGPNIHTGNVILCFIYKFRMRYANVVGEIYKRENKIENEKFKNFLEYYKKYNFYLEDVQSCDVNCSCG